MPVLTNKMEQYVRSFPSRQGYSEEIKSKYGSRLVDYATTSLEQLTLLIQKLPEDMQTEIFSEKYLKPFFRALFRIEPGKAITEKDRIRRLKICNLALSEIAIRTNAAILAPNAWRTIKEMPTSTHDSIYGTNAIQALQIEEIEWPNPRTASKDRGKKRE